MYKKIISIIPPLSHDDLFAQQSQNTKLTWVLTTFEVDSGLEKVDFKRLYTLAQQYLTSEKTQIDKETARSILKKIKSVIDSVCKKQKKVNMDKDNYKSAKLYLQKMVLELQNSNLIKKSKQGDLDNAFTALAEASEACGSNLFGSIFSAYIEVKVAKVNIESPSSTENIGKMMQAIFQDLLIIAYKQIIDSHVLPKVIRLLNPSEVNNHLRNEVYQLLAAEDEIVAATFPKHTDQYRSLDQNQLTIAKAIVKEAKKVMLGTPSLIDHLSTLVNQIQSVRLKLLAHATLVQPSPDESQDDLDYLHQKHMINIVQNQVDATGQTVECQYITPLGLLKLLTGLHLVEHITEPRQQVEAEPTLEERIAVLVAFKRDDELVDLINSLVTQGQDILAIFSAQVFKYDAEGGSSPESILSRMIETGCVESLNLIFKIINQEPRSRIFNQAIAFFKMNYFLDKNGCSADITAVTALKYALPEALKFSLKSHNSLIDNFDDIFKKLPDSELEPVFQLILLRKEIYVKETKQFNITELSKLFKNINNSQFMKLLGHIEFNQKVFEIAIKSAVETQDSERVSVLLDACKFQLEQTVIDAIWEIAVNGNFEGVIQVLRDKHHLPSPKTVDELVLQIVSADTQSSPVNPAGRLKTVLAIPEFKDKALRWEISATRHNLIHRAVHNSALTDDQLHDMVDALIGIGVRTDQKTSDGLNMIGHLIVANRANELGKRLKQFSKQLIEVTHVTGSCYDKQMPLEMAITSQNDDIRRELLDYLATVNCTEYRLAIEKITKVIEWATLDEVLRKYTDSDYPYERRIERALFWSVIHNRKDLVTELMRLPTPPKIDAVFEIKGSHFSAISVADDDMRGILQTPPSPIAPLQLTLEPVQNTQARRGRFSWWKKSKRVTPDTSTT
jgi:hypothetical protein